MWKRHSRLVLALTVLAAGSSAGFADDTRKPTSSPPPDDELLEFLGSVDPAPDTVHPDDGSWDEYLSQTDIGKVAKTGNPTVVAAKPPTPPPKPSSTPGAKQDE
jgi:hypothetical protein